MTKLTKKQEALLNELLKDFDGDPEAMRAQDGLEWSSRNAWLRLCWKAK